MRALRALPRPSASSRRSPPAPSVAPIRRETAILRQGEPTLDAYVDRSRAGRDPALDALRPVHPRPARHRAISSARRASSTRATRSGDAVTPHRSRARRAAFARRRAGAIERDQRVAMALYWAFWKSLSTKLRTHQRPARRASSRTRRAEARSAPAPRDQVADRRVPARHRATKRDLFAEQKLSSLEINFLDLAVAGAQAQARARSSSTKATRATRCTSCSRAGS